MNSLDLISMFNNLPFTKKEFEHLHLFSRLSITSVVCDNLTTKEELSEPDSEDPAKKDWMMLTINIEKQEFDYTYSYSIPTFQCKDFQSLIPLMMESEEARKEFIKDLYLNILDVFCNNQSKDFHKVFSSCLKEKVENPF